MKENQNIEWKESWRDEYLKYICGFANSTGGKLVVGRDDDGHVAGVMGVRKLLEDIPNKVRDIMGIMVMVNHRTLSGKDTLEVVVEPHPYPVSYKGEYYIRSGSTLQALKGAALDRFLLKKQGKGWDSVPIPHLQAKGLSAGAFLVFKKRASQSDRVPREILREGKAAILENLQLTDGKHLKRAAALLFSDRPEKYVTGAYIKIGYFVTDDDLRYQDEVHGNLFEQVEKTLELMWSKYLKAFIRYEGIQRIEEYLLPQDAFREALLNAVVHKDYSGHVPIQISVYEEKIVLWNYGQLPDHWTLERLQRKHPSKPHNPLLAEAFFRAGYVESWGRGIEKMNRECREHGMPPPTYDLSMSGLMLAFHANPRRMAMLRDIRRGQKAAERGATPLLPPQSPPQSRGCLPRW